ncbi:unnamed protein product [Sphagnum jensenii]|uniref:Uncharacterized protein n=1 Tax=Sphagnum jensenii TaxID=128206 RepID=A0ABP1ABK1_9BRYO
MDHVIVGGDFNHLEETDHQGVSGERQMHRREVVAWHHMTLLYALADAWWFDSFRKMSKKEFTYDNGRLGACSTVSRINKFLVSQDIEERGGRMEFQKDPSDVEVRDIISDTQGKLAEVFQDSMARNRHLTSTNWLMYGNTCSKVFFYFHRIGKKKTMLRELETESRTITGQQDLTHYIMNFYSRLYTSDALALGTAEAQEQCWQSVPTKVTSDTNASLMSCLTLEEIQSTIRALPKGKALGHDGIPMEFFVNAHKMSRQTSCKHSWQCSAKESPRPSSTKV